MLFPVIRLALSLRDFFNKFGIGNCHHNGVIFLRCLYRILVFLWGGGGGVGAFDELTLTCNFKNGLRSKKDIENSPRIEIHR